MYNCFFFLNQLPNTLPKISTFSNYITNYFSIINYIANYLRQKQIRQEKKKSNQLNEFIKHNEVT